MDNQHGFIITSQSIVSIPDSLPKGEGESGTAAYTAICSPWNLRDMNLIGCMLLNCIVALHRWLSMEKWSVSDLIIL